jgi:HD-GYP domain-containing protein (c-di-GMP phosphodiesterase class II)
VGKIVISDAILKKQRSLNKAEIMEIKRHPSLSYDILSKINFPWRDLVQTVKHHHERPDGKGYPDHMDDHNLSIGARILSLADAFDAMTTSRPYRKKMDLKAAIEELVRYNHLQFDPQIITAFCHALEKEIKGELPEPNIIPQLNVDFDPAVITTMLETIRLELAEPFELGGGMRTRTAAG